MNKQINIPDERRFELLNLEKDCLIFGTEGIDEDSIHKTIVLFLMTEGVKQITFVINSGKQVKPFNAVLSQFSAARVFLYEDEEGRSRCADINHFESMLSLLKVYKVAKKSHRILSAFYVSEDSIDVGYWTLIKGDRYESP